VKRGKSTYANQWVRLQELFPDFSSDQMEKLNRYADMLVEWNRRVHLISRADEQRVWTHHLLPSLIVLKLTELPAGGSLLDLGSGGGLPGLPLKMARPDLSVVLVESVRKKALFLKRVVEELGLTGIAVINERLEPGREARWGLGEKIDVVTARAVAEVNVLWELSVRLLRPGGALITWKGDQEENEFRQFQKQLSLSGEILAVPSRWHDFSPRFPHMRIFRLEKS